MLLGIVACVSLLTACDISSADEVTRQVSLNIAGSYTNAGGIPANQTGNTISLLSISQRGDQLNAVDDQGARWTGTIGRADGTLATFTLDGATSAGQEVVLTGTIVVDGTTATLSGTWIEPSLRSVATATATVSGVVTPTPTPTATPVPTT